MQTIRRNSSGTRLIQVVRISVGIIMMLALFILVYGIAVSSYSNTKEFSNNKAAIKNGTIVIMDADGVVVTDNEKAYKDWNSIYGINTYKEFDMAYNT